MDLNAILLCQESGLMLRVFNMNKQGALHRILLGENIGTLIKAEYS
jgi:uridylate kinase